MHYLAALAASALAVAAGHAPTVQKAAEISTTAEVYVAQMDQDWNVTRQIRVPCSIDEGCAVDLGLDKAGLSRVRVLFDAVRSGKVAVTSVVEDQAGHQLPRLDFTIGLDRSGFGAEHFEAGIAKAAAQADGAEGQPIIMMAVKVPGWAVPLGSSAAAGGDKT